MSQQDRSRNGLLIPVHWLYGALGALAALALACAVIASSASATQRPAANAAALCVVKTQNKYGELVPVYKTKRVKGKTVFIYKTVTKKVKVKGKSVKRKVRVKVPKKASCSKTKRCVVKKRNSKGRSVTVYLTRIAKVKVRKGGKIRTVKKRVFVYKTKIVKKRVKRNGRTVTVKRRAFVFKNGKKIKVPKLGACSKKTTTNSGVPVSVTLTDPSVANLDFGGFKRQVPLSGQLKGFIVGTGFKLGQENQLQLSGGRINLEPTGIFIDDLCNGEVTDAIRTNPASYAEIDPATNPQNNTVNIAPNSAITGLVHLRIQTALDLRNKETGCHQPYLTTGWTDFSVPLFIKGKLSAGQQGLTSTITVGQTVLDKLSACLALGKPTLPCNGFAIPFPAIFTSKITGIVKIG